MLRQSDASEAAQQLYCCFTVCPHPFLFHLTCSSVSEACLFGVVLIARACVFGLCWLGGQHAWCRADGVPSAPCGSAVPSTLLSHRERRADRLLQGEHHFLRPSLPLAETNRDTHTHVRTLAISVSALSSFIPHFLPLLFDIIFFQY